MITSELMSKLIELSEPVIQEDKWMLRLPITEELGKYLNIEISYPEPNFFEDGGIIIEVKAIHKQDSKGNECYATIENSSWDNDTLQDMKKVAGQQALNRAIEYYYPNLLDTIFALFSWSNAYNNEFQN